MSLENRKLFRQKLQGGGALIPLGINVATKMPWKKTLWNLMKIGATPWAVDQFTDIADPSELKTADPDSTNNPNDKTTATLDLNEKIQKDIATGNNNLQSNPPGAAGNVDLTTIDGTLPDISGGDGDDAGVAGEDEDDTTGEKQQLLYKSAQDLDAGTLFADNGSLTEIKGYADSLRNLLGDDKGQRTANTAMLAQLGMALMTGKTLQGGVSGFFDVAGQAGLQVATMMIQMGMEQSKQDRELGLAAFQIWKEEKDNATKRSGSFYNMYQVGYEFDQETGLPKHLPNGQPRYAQNTFRDVVQQNSPEMTNYINANKDPRLNPNYPYPMFIPISQSASEAGGMGFGAAGNVTGLASITKAGAQDQLKFAKYIQTNMDEVYRYLKIAMDKQHLIGAPGELGRYMTAPAYYLNELFTSGGVEEQRFMSEMKGQGQETINSLIDGYTEGSVNPDMSTDGTFGIVNNTPNSSMGKIWDNYTGPDLPVFVDYKNDKGQNTGISAEKPYGSPAIYLVKSELDRMFTDPDIPGMQVFERTLGLLMARSRQPTGRMLADVLRASFDDASVTGFTGANVRANMVINKLWGLANKLEGDMQAGFLSAGRMSSQKAVELYGSIEEAKAMGAIIDDRLFTFDQKDAAIDRYYQLYFNYRNDNNIWEEAYTNHPGTGTWHKTTPADWMGRKNATIGISQKEDIMSLDEQMKKEMKITETW